MSRSPRIIAVSATVLATLGSAALGSAPATASSPTVGVSCASQTFPLHKGETSAHQVQCLATDGSVIDSYALVTGPEHAAPGSGFKPDGSFTYTPAAGFTGTDSFTFTASSGAATSDPTKVTFTVSNRAVSCAPVADQSVVHDRVLSLTPPCTDADGDPITLQPGNVAPEHGRLTVVSGGLRYVPAAGYVGDDEFSYRASDGSEVTPEQPVSVTVTNAAPVCTAVTGTTVHDRPLQLPVTCSDADGDEVTLSLGARPQHGMVLLGSTGLLYLPADGFTGTDTFGVTPNDGVTDGPAAVGTVSVTNAVPTLSVRDSLRVREETDFRLTTSDPDGDPVTVTVVRQPRHGTLTIDGRTGTYVPDVGYVGDDSFSVRGTDGVARTGIETVDVTVLPALPEVTAVEVHRASAWVTIDCQQTRRTCAGDAAVSIDLGVKTIAGTADFSAKPGADTLVRAFFSPREQRLLAKSKARHVSVDTVLTTRDSKGGRAVVRATVDAPRYR